MKNSVEVLELIIKEVINPSSSGHIPISFNYFLITNRCYYNLLITE